MKPLSIRSSTIHGSVSLQLNAQYLALKKQGKPAISLGVGEPDFDTPAHIKKAANDALKRGATHYVATAGIPEVREAVAQYFKKYHRVEYTPNEVMVCNGAKQAILNALLVILNPGDEVVIPEPSWFSFAELVKLVGGVPVSCPTENLMVRASLIEQKITHKTRAIILNSPSNPTGEVIPSAELKKIAALVHNRDLFVISDEMYHRYLFAGRHTSIASCKDMYERTFLVNGVSKTYAMTGWRCGFVGAPEQFISAMTRIQDHATGCINVPTQWGVVAALSGTQAPVTAMLKEFEKRRKYILQRLNEINGMVPNNPAGAFYVFPDISEFRCSSFDFCQRLLAEKLVVAIPGSAFGAGGEGHIRLSYATSMKNIKEAMDRIEKFVKKF
ncbi:MAG: pyridoxal phosphate-dependent aminotransferase [Candidatus Woesearchaeota archaeon]|nr:pyridoxal phosphate-dependent aminotransferase [Candidatus Woesearchaeota archaeon]